MIFEIGMFSQNFQEGCTPLYRSTFTWCRNVEKWTTLLYYCCTTTTRLRINFSTRNSSCPGNSKAFEKKNYWIRPRFHPYFKGSSLFKKCTKNEKNSLKRPSPLPQTPPKPCDLFSLSKDPLKNLWRVRLNSNVRSIRM